MNYLLDANVISALRVRGRNPQVERWAASRPLNALFTSALSIAEMERGIAAKERTDPEQGSTLRDWLENNVLPAFAGRVLPFDLAAARILATYRVPEHAPYDDALIAAVAQANSMIIATRNIKHFSPLGLECLDPWDHA